MEIAFATKGLRSICESQASAVAEFGADMAARLQPRIADLRAATTVADVRVGRPRELADGKRMAVQVSEGLSIVFAPNHATTPRTKGNVDWTRVTRICIVQIGAAHDN